MMRDNLDPHLTPGEEPAARRDEAEATDREVPLSARQTPAIIQAWLDGEKVDEAALKAAGGYEFWSRLKSETDRRRRMRTPSPITGAIMEAVKKEKEG